jgi:hypothetical protein
MAVVAMPVMIPVPASWPLVWPEKMVAVIAGILRRMATPPAQ